MSDDVRRELEQIKAQLYVLMHRVQQLERRLETESRSVVPMAPSEPAPAVSGRPEVPAAQPEAREVGVQPLERVLGGRVALYGGIGLLFLATAFFLGWAWARLTPEGRLALGYLGGAALLGLGMLTYRRAERWFAEGLMGAGLATLYLTTWAGWERYQLLSFAGAFGLTIALVVLGMSLAVWRGSETLAVVATIGGFAAPGWLRAEDGAGSPLNFFGYLTALNAGMLAIAAWRAWHWHTATCLAATVALLWGWSLGSYTPEFRMLTLGFVSLYYALFAAAYLVPGSVRRGTIPAVDLAQFAIASLLYLPVGYALSREAWGDYPGAFLALAGAIYLALSGGYYRLGDVPAAATLFTLAFACALGAIGVQFQPEVRTLLYSLIAAGLIIGGLRHTTRLLYGFGILTAFGTAFVLLDALSVPIRAPYVILNEHGVAWLGVLLGGGASLYALYRSLQVSHKSPLDGIFPRQALALLGTVGVVMALAWFSAEQTLYAFELGGRRGAPTAHMLVSLEWTLLGAALLLGGVQYALRALRLMGLGMLALTASKLFLYDLSFLEMPYRAFTFAGLGLTLIAVAWLYGRYERARMVA